MAKKRQVVAPFMSCHEMTLTILADVRFGARTLTQTPGFTTVAIVALAIGIGGTTALFSLIDAVLLRPLPFAEPHRLVEISGQDHERTGMRVPGAILDALRARAKTLQVIGTHDPSGGVSEGADGPVEIRGEAVSANFVEVFGVQPMAGRAFEHGDERAGAPAVMLVSFAFWRQRLGADRNAVGRVVNVDGVPYIVIGIMPQGFRTTFLNATPVFWTPYAGSRSRVRERELGYELVARLSPGATLEQTRLEIDAIASQVDVEEWRRTSRRLGIVSLRDEVVGNRAYALTLLLTAVAVVLSVACANVAQLLLARSDSRLREFGTRKAIGASTVQLFRLALVESLLLSLAGGAAGVVVAYWLVPVMLALAPREIPRLLEASIDGRVLAVAFTISVLTGAVFGSAPALRLSRLSVAQALRPTIGAASRHRARFRPALVVIQVASAVILVVLAALVVQTFLTLLPASPGFATRSRAAFIWSLRENQFPDAADRRRRVDDWIERLEAVPGVVAVAVASSIPFGDDESRNIPVRRSSDVRPATETALRTEVRAISLNYLHLFQLRLLRGRPFAATDRAEAPRVAIVNQTLARRLEPSGNVLGQSVKIGTAATAPEYQIIGIVSDTRWWGMTLDPLNEVYTPIAQDRSSFGFVVVQSLLDDTSLTDVIKTSFRAAFPGAAIPDDRRAVVLDEMISRSVAGPRFSATLFSAFSTTALILAATGLFGLVSYSVSQRRRELGIRAALGAQPAVLVRTCVQSAVVLTTIGVAAGLAGGAYVTRFIQSQLYAVNGLDLATFSGAAVVMLAAAALAAYVPARRAAYADATTVLRHE